ncbi:MULTISPECIES: 4-(cytidine 5'-diphospho)-2-C-methyl-D-erythritol kinase [unclassified Moraxella]|uniref:4-(cytidine 5'-diphospho)-2-C-methyl-D-erythritol kinase n=1 Tax=unclassified Moraxella TaxID=2685852 RepID=UPI003AF966C1
MHLTPPITQLAPAKINLFLHITGKRPDGYHNLQTVFRLIDLYDTLTFQPTDQPIGEGNMPIRLNDDPTITQDLEQNLIVKASGALFAFAQQHQLIKADELAKLPIIDIHLDKKIPMGAGLGGGSSDCATTLMTLNQLWQLGMTSAQLQAIGATLGADVPIFIFGKDAIAEGIGEVLTPIALPPQQLLLLKPNAHINTKQLFAHQNLQRNCPSFAHEFLQHHNHEFTQQLSQNFGNVFEPVVTDLSEAVNDALAYLHTLANVTHTTPRMTGSGSCVFLPLPDDMTSSILEKWQADSPCQAWQVKTLS